MYPLRGADCPKKDPAFEYSCVRVKRVIHFTLFFPLPPPPRCLFHARMIACAHARGGYRMHTMLIYKKKPVRKEERREAVEHALCALYTTT